MGALAGSALFTLWLHGDSLSYGFLYDDPMDLPRAGGRSFLEIMTSAGESSYYRPFILMVWKALFLLQGAYDARLLHMLVLAVHAFAGWLVFLLGMRLANWVIALMAAALFLAFPFDYQAVPSINSTFHPVVTSFVLLAVLLHLEARRPGRWWLLPFAVIFTGLAAFTHESGVAAAPLILLLEMREALLKRRTRFLYVPLYFLVVAGFALAWYLAPRWQREFELDPLSLGMNGLYFIQGFTFPVSSYASRLSYDDAANLLIVAGAALAALLMAHLFSKRLLYLGFALAWYAVALLPAWLFLPYTGYVEESPRLMYMASVGAALAWAGLLGTSDRLRPRPWVHRATGLVLAAAFIFVLWQSVSYVQRRGELYRVGSKVMAQVVSAAEQNPQGRTFFVNFPSWYAFRNQEHRFGHSGVSILPDYIGLERTIYMATGKHLSVESLSYPVTTKEWALFWGPHGKPAWTNGIADAIRAADVIYYADFQDDTIELQQAGRYLGRTPHPKETPYLAAFDQRFFLEEADIVVEGRQVNTELRWYSSDFGRDDYTVSLHVYDAQGKQVARKDGYPLADLFPIEYWRPDDWLTDKRELSLPPDLRPEQGPFSLFIDIYNRKTGQRLPALSPSGQPFQDSLVPLARFELRENLALTEIALPAGTG